MFAFRALSFGSLAALLLGILPASVASADIYISNYGTDTVRRYTNSGTLINANFITGFSDPTGIAVSGNNVFVASDQGYVSLYNNSGTLVTPNLITGLSHPHDLLVSGDYLYVADDQNHRVGRYTISTNTYSPNFISGLAARPTGLAISGNTLFVSSGLPTTTPAVGSFDATTGAAFNTALVPISGNQGMGGMTVIGSELYALNAGSTPNGRISKYDFLGNAINASLVSGLNNPWGLATDGTNLFNTNFFGNSVSVYNTSGGVVNAAFITGLSLPTGIYVTPEPASLMVGLLGGGCLLARRVRRRNG